MKSTTGIQKKSSLPQVSEDGTWMLFETRVACPGAAPLYRSAEVTHKGHLPQLFSLCLWAYRTDFIHPLWSGTSAPFPKKKREGGVME